MKIHHLRNATALLHVGEHCLLIDPMLAEPDTLPGFKLFGRGRRANPLVPLPPNAFTAMERATGVVVTHEHPDHLDASGIEWIKARGLPVWTNGVDAPGLRSKGLDVHELCDGALGMRVELIPGRHGRGWLGWMMGPTVGYYLAHPGEPSVYITGDTVLTSAVMDAVTRLRPEVIIAPAGAANVGVGGDILFSVAELVTLAERAPRLVVLNHLEALDHCPTTRSGLGERMAAEGLAARVHIPEDGEETTIERRDTDPHVLPGPHTQRGPGFQKWLTAHVNRRIAGATSAADSRG
ncbi:MBL fold metallo-hydrolase [Haliangium sp.]|uniref:MBL fold metallo-hydrolase n=1 Tax=Haliangium sp. TaxID=2663208 RepID=UPI003D106377